MSVLFVNTCVRKNSRTKLLADYFLSKWNDKDVREVNPVKEGLYGLDAQLLHIRDHALFDGNYDHPVLFFASQFAKADTIVIGAPYWDLSFPAALKNYIERVNAVGVTFAYDEAGNPYGLCAAKQLVYISTAGGPLISDSYGYGYVKALCENFYHIEKTVCFCAENLDMPYCDVTQALEKVKAEMDAWLEENQ